MNLTNSKGSISAVTTATVSMKSGEGSDPFPAGLRVLVVDDDPTCLKILEKMLRSCYYEVTQCNRAEAALSLLRENKNGFDIVISDVHMPDMDGFKLLEHIGLEMDLPVIMMSADDGKHVVMKGVTHGACDYLIKPVRMEALKNIWQHVVRKKKNNDWKDSEQSGSADEGDRHPKASDDADYSSSANESNWRSSRKRRDDEEDGDDRDDSSTLKKPRVVWSVELHQQFVAAVDQLGIDKAVPKKILELMNVPGLTRENVASHLQKYRLYLRRLSGVSQHQNNSFLSPQEASFGTISSMNGLDLQTLAAAGQLPAQSLATLQAAGLGRSAVKSGLPMPLMDQRNLFSFENPRLRFGEGQQQLLSNNKQTNLLHGVPTNMEPKQLANLHQSAAQSLGNLNMRVPGSSPQGNPLLMQMAQQSQPRGQMLSENTSPRVPRLPNLLGQSTVSNGISDGLLGRNGIASSSRGPSFNSVPQSSLFFNSPMNQSTEMSVTNFPLGSTPGISSITNKGTFQAEVNSGIKGSAGFPSYDIFNELNHQKPRDWGMTNPGLTYDSSQHANPLHGNIDVSPSVLVHQGYSSTPQNGHNRDNSLIGKSPFSLGESSGQGNFQNGVQHFNPIVENSTRVIKSEIVPDASSQTNLFPDHYGQEDLMSVLLKQEGIVQGENEFDFDGYSLDNIPV
ncbi:unnamed protein product [Lathyrus sativus]|nr:unnamed protein product [Lathyrus sativus]